MSIVSARIRGSGYRVCSDAVRIVTVTTPIRLLP